jgi:hypothetical protein
LADQPFARVQRDVDDSGNGQHGFGRQERHTNQRMWPAEVPAALIPAASSSRTPPSRHRAMLLQQAKIERTLQGAGFTDRDGAYRLFGASEEL